jgi:hypothetical protein
MQELKKYIAVIQNKDADHFDIVLAKLSLRSNIRVGNRLTTIIPAREQTTYEVALSDEEACLLALSCPGRYEYFSDDKISESINQFMKETTG